VVGGVAAGLGQYLGVDPRLLRVAFGVLTLFGGAGLAMYLVAWAVVPRTGYPQAPIERFLDWVRHAPIWVQILLLIVVLLSFANDWSGGSGIFAAALLILLGWVLFRQDTRTAVAGGPPGPGPIGPGAGPAGPGSGPGGSEGPGGPGYPPSAPGGQGPALSAAAPADAPAGPGLPPSAPSGGAPEAPPASAQVGDQPGDQPGGEPGELPLELRAMDRPSANVFSPEAFPPGAYDTYAYAMPPAPGQAGPPAGWTPPVRRRPRSPLGRVTVAAALLGVGGAAALDAAGAINLDLRGYLALALTVVGAGLLVGAFLGRARGLIALGLLLLPPMVAVSLLRVPVQGGVGDRLINPSSIVQIDSDYRLGAGRMVLDLSDVGFAATPTNVHATVAAGELRVIVPDETEVRVHARATGETILFGTEQGDNNGDDVRSIDVTTTSPGKPDGGRLDLDLQAGLGLVRVLRESQPLPTP
jgi:phage shock protein PspC (stress-responsive transcriptional regulator)